MEVRLGDIFQLQDSLTSQIVESLAIPLSARDERVLKRDVPASAQAYEYYLRANQIAHDAKNWTVARDLYRQCLAEDPRYAPAWARLARIYRLISIYSGSAGDDHYALAEEAFRRALELNPDLSIAHNLFTVLELETGRPRQALLRLLERARIHSNDPELFAGLVQACRYAGLQRPAIAAYEHARRLEPQIRTAVAHAYLMAGDYERAVETDAEDPSLIAVLALDLLGRRDQAIARLRGQVVSGIPLLYRLFLEGTLAVLEDRRASALTSAAEIVNRWHPRDPCGRYYLARTLALLEHPAALSTFRRSVEGGFYCYSFFLRDPWLDPLRSDPAFNEVLEFAETQSRDAAEAFVAAGGDRMLGPVQRD
jgi:tetratricopeptide (TPR) repeat protein